MQVQEEEGPAANLCDLCSIVERSFFSAFPVPPDDEGRRKIRYHESLGDLVKSASGGCGLCKVFLHGFLHAQLRSNETYYADIHAVKDYLLTMENLALIPKFEEGKPNNKCPFYLYLDEDPFLVPQDGDESYECTGFVSLELKRFWQHQDRWDLNAIFSITSEAGMITQYTKCI